MLHEARRIVRPGGTVAVFDGDYASLTFAYPDHLMAKTIEEKLIQLIVANPRIMRDMPRLVAEAGLELIDAEGVLYANIGSGGFWLAAAESYGPLLARSELLTQQIADEWRDFQVRSVGRQHLLRRLQLLHLPDAAARSGNGLKRSARTTPINPNLLTVSHVIDWTARPGFAADWVRFTPSSFDGGAPFGEAYGIHVYWYVQEDGDGFITGNEGDFDDVVVVLDRRLGATTGWMGARGYDDDWDELAAWSHTGYPGDLNSGQRGELFEVSRAPPGTGGRRISTPG